MNNRNLEDNENSCEIYYHNKSQYTEAYVIVTIKPAVLHTFLPNTFLNTF